MHPVCKKYVLKSKKFRKKIPHVKGHVLCAPIVSHKPNIFCVLCKKKRKKARQMYYFSIKICIFYTWHITCRFLLKQLCDHVICQNIHGTFYFVFFKHF